ncbi:MAG: metallophosphoesterase [Phycisphaerae bacterium]|nr:metallophosphoesterase [Phycisphaerae bacterium]
MNHEHADRVLARDRPFDAPGPEQLLRTTRREAIGIALLGALGVSTVASAQSVTPPPAATTAAAPRSRVARIAHLTDVHVQPERGAEAGFVQCLHHVQAQADRPDVIVTGGDHVMDVFEQQAPRAALVGGMWRDIVKRDCSLRVESAIGSHDIRGWHSKAAMKETEPGYGKSFALDLLGLPQRYHTFDLTAGAGTWQVIVLDSIQKRPDSYRCYLDEEQLAWVTTTLTAKPKDRPTLVVSHAPVLSLAPLTIRDRRNDDDVTVPGSLIHLDGYQLHQLFRKHQVRLCLSGHLHLLDQCAIDGVTYICGGAVSGNWWKGSHHGVVEGYGLVDLFDDGSFAHQYVPYGWNVRS